MSAQLLNSPNTTLLPIPLRFQWDNHNGYCGETSINSSLLYLGGGYISQLRARQAAGSEVLLGENAAQTIEKFGLTYQSWDTDNQEEPQIQRYLTWIKKHLSENHPVIVAGYEPEGKMEAYDHIYLAVGFNSESQDFNEEDSLIYTDHYDPNLIVTPFGKVYDTRAMDGNGKDLQFALPKDVCFGIAITGIVNEEKFQPIRVLWEEDREPNVTQGQAATVFKLTVKISSLTHGEQYALLRYNHYSNLPTDNVEEAKANEVKKFTANGDSHEIEDEVNSDGMVFYRCVKVEDLE